MNLKIKLHPESGAIHQGLMFTPFRKFKKSEEVYAQGERSTHLYLVKNGAVKISVISETGNEQIMDILGDGEIFGEWGGLIYPEMLFKESAIVLTENTCIHRLNISSLSFQQKSMAFFELAPTILAQKERGEKRLGMLANQDAAFRIRETLKDLALKTGHKFGEEILLKIGLSHEDISRLANTSRQTVTKEMNELRNQKKIYYTRDRILFRNLEGIHQ